MNNENVKNITLISRGKLSSVIQSLSQFFNLSFIRYFLLTIYILNKVQTLRLRCTKMLYRDLISLHLALTMTMF